MKLINCDKCEKLLYTQNAQKSIQCVYCMNNIKIKKQDLLDKSELEK